MVAVFFAVFMAGQPPLSGQENVGISTVSPSGFKDSEFTLNIVKNEQDSRMELDYVLRWDFNDFKKFSMSFKGLRSIISPVKGWDITENTRFSFYGFRINPWRVIIKKEKTYVHGSGQAGIADQKPQYKKKLILSLSPLIEDLTDDFDRQVKNVLLEESFKEVIPQWKDADRKSKRMFIRDLLSIEELWQYEEFGSPRKGLEYISE